MEDDLSDLFTDAHFHAFGVITTAYASCETGIKLCLAGTLGLPPYNIMILTEPYSSLALRNVAKSIAKLDMPPQFQEQFIQIVGDWGSQGKLRNYIAHNRWTRGTRPKSIRPVQMDIRSGKANFTGYEDGDPDYSLEDIQRAASTLVRIDERIRRFLKNTGLADAIERNIIEASKANDAWLSGSAANHPPSPDNTN